MEITWTPDESKKSEQTYDAKYNKKIILSSMKANLTRDVDTIGKQDPYVKATLNKENVKKTKVAEDAGKNPVWDGVLEFLIEKEQTLKIEIMDEGTTSDTLIAEGSIDLTKLKTGKSDTSIDVLFKGFDFIKFFS